MSPGVSPVNVYRQWFWDDTVKILGQNQDRLARRTDSALWRMSIMQAGRGLSCFALFLGLLMSIACLRQFVNAIINLCVEGVCAGIFVAYVCCSSEARSYF